MPGLVPASRLLRINSTYVVASVQPASSRVLV
jgi:hypothetical protein